MGSKKSYRLDLNRERGGWKVIVIERDSQTDRKKRERGTKRQNTEYKYTMFFF